MKAWFVVLTFAAAIGFGSASHAQGPMQGNVSGSNQQGSLQQGQQNGQQGNMRRRGGPPHEALNTCQNMSSGASCSFEGHNGTMSGTCFAPNDSLPLACKPDRRQGQGNEQGQRGPRPQQVQ